MSKYIKLSYKKANGIIMNPIIQYKMSKYIKLTYKGVKEIIMNPITQYEKREAEKREVKNNEREQRELKNEERVRQREARQNSWKYEREIARKERKRSNEINNGSPKTAEEIKHHIYVTGLCSSPENNKIKALYELLHSHDRPHYQSEEEYEEEIINRITSMMMIRFVQFFE